MSDGLEVLLRFAAGAERKVPERFTEFCVSIGVELTPGQRAYALVAFDGLNPCELEGEDRELARQIFGEFETFRAGVRRILAAVFGGRSGKSYALGALRLLHLALTVSLHTIAPGEHAEALIVAPDMEQSMHTLQFVAGALESRLPHAMAAKPTATRCLVKRPDGQIVAIVCRAATKGGAAVRGRSLVGVLLEECAFFRSDKFVVNDTEIFRAVAPRVLVGGQLLLNSTPWAEEGLLYDFYSRNAEQSHDAIAARAPTLLMRDNADTRAYVEMEYQRDQDNARREFGAEFMKSGAYQFFPTAAIEASMAAWQYASRDATVNVVAAGGDFAFVRNSAALAVAVRDHDKTTISEIREKKPDGAPLRPGDVVSDFAVTLTEWGAEEIAADGHYRESIREHLEPHDIGIVATPEGSGGKAEMHVLSRQLLLQGKLLLPDDPKLRRQLCDVTGKPTAGGGISIKAPEWKTGEHGDLVSAVLAAVWAASRMALPELPEPGPPAGSAEFYEAQEAARLARWQEQWESEQSESDSTWILGPR
jgi:hypothetical protein